MDSTESVHDQPYNEKPLTNVDLIFTWETECDSGELFPEHFLNPTAKGGDIFLFFSLSVH